MQVLVDSTLKRRALNVGLDNIYGCWVCFFKPCSGTTWHHPGGSRVSGCLLQKRGALKVPKSWQFGNGEAHADGHASREKTRT